MQQIQIQQPSGETRNATNTNTTTIRGNTKANKYIYNNHEGKYEMQKIQIQQPSGETRNATYTITTIIRGNTKSNKYKYKQSPGEIQLLAFHQVIVRKTKFYSFVYTHLNVYVEIKFTGYETNISSFLQARECFKIRQYMWRWHQSQGLLFHLHTALPFCVTLYCVPS